MNRNEIRECMEQVHIGEEMQREIICNLRKRMEGGKRKRSLGKMAAMAASCVLLVGILAISVQAAISNFVKERMENIAAEELDGLAEMTQQQSVNCDTYSREYTETEKMRAKELQEAYHDGLFPEQKILLVDNVEQAPSDRLSYARDVSCYCLPGREMTDEELLEIIDFDHTRAYAISQSACTPKPEERETQRQEQEIRQQELGERVQAAEGISESEAGEIAREYLETTPGFSLEGLELFSAALIDVKDSDCNTEAGIVYGVIFYDSEKCAICLLIVDAVSGRVISVNGEEVADSEGSTETPDADAGAEELFKAALLGDIRFSYGMETVAITDIPSLFDANDPLMKIWEFCVIDLDGDGEEEVILYVASAAGDMGGKVILHQIGGELYAYITDNRTLVDLKTDGTYSYSDPTGLAETGIAEITGFSETGYTVDRISWAVGTYEGWESFNADRQPATEEKYLDVVSGQDKKQNAERFDFTMENINTIFSNAGSVDPEFTFWKVE